MPEDPVNPFESPKTEPTVVKHTTITLGNHVMPAFFVGLCGTAALLELLLFSATGNLWDLGLFAINAICVFMNVNTIMNTQTTQYTIYDDSK